MKHFYATTMAAIINEMILHFHNDEEAFVVVVSVLEDGLDVDDVLAADDQRRVTKEVLLTTQYFAYKLKLTIC
jgi:hypothetical protein